MSGCSGGPRTTSTTSSLASASCSSPSASSGNEKIRSGDAGSEPCHSSGSENPATVKSADLDRESTPVTRRPRRALRRCRALDAVLAESLASGSSESWLPETATTSSASAAILGADQPRLILVARDDDITGQHDRLPATKPPSDARIGSVRCGGPSRRGPRGPRLLPAHGAFDEIGAELRQARRSNPAA